MRSTLIAFLKDQRARNGAKLVRYGAVSAFNVIFGQVLLYGAQVALNWPPVMANTASVCVGAIPAYYLSRRWVWEMQGKNDVMREIVPFWTLTLLGFALSTAAVWFVDTRVDDPAALIVNLTNLAAFGVVWVAKFVVLDRMVFKPEEAPAVS